jgi:hypothetical protein
MFNKGDIVCTTNENFFYPHAVGRSRFIIVNTTIFADPTPSMEINLIELYCFACENLPENIGCTFFLPESHLIRIRGEQE